MHLEPTETGFQIDAGDLASLLGLARENVQRLMREGQINSLSEAGEGADAGRHRISFRYRSTRVRLTVDAQGEVLLRSRTTVVPRPGTPANPEIAPAEPARDSEPHHDHDARLGINLPELVLLAEMIEDLHTGDEGNPVGLSGVLRCMSTTLDARMKAAERISSPAFRTGAISEREAVKAALQADRDGLERDIGRIRDITNEFTLPDAACSSWATLYAGLSNFVDDLANHLRLEGEMLSRRSGPASV